MSQPGTEKRALPKRFYRSVGVDATDAGFTVVLDGRTVKTPARELLAVPSEPLASALAEEWDRQDPEIDPETMLFTKLANTAIDRVQTRHRIVADEISAFGASDLLCYRAESPEELVRRQEEGWDPLLDWLEGHVGGRLTVASGVMFQSQPPEILSALQENVVKRSAFELSGIHQAVSLTGSLVLGLALAEGRLDADAAHDLSTMDEAWQAEKWGWDKEAQERLEMRRNSLRAAAEYLELLRAATSS